MGRTLALGLALVLTACENKHRVDEEDDCYHETEAGPLLETSVAPDFDVVVTFEIESQEQPWEDGGKLRIQAWDCLDLAWWLSTTPRKVVQIYTDETECELFEGVEISYYDCGSHEGPDAPYRDYDGDGISAADGDCDDEDPTTGGDLIDGDGTSDCVDDDGDGLSEEEGDTNDADPGTTQTTDTDTGSTDTTDTGSGTGSTDTGSGTDTDEDTTTSGGTGDSP